MNNRVEASKVFHKMVCEENKAASDIPVKITCKYCKQSKTRLDAFQEIMRWGTEDPLEIEVLIACLDCGEEFLEELAADLNYFRERIKTYGDQVETV